MNYKADKCDAPDWQSAVNIHAVLEAMDFQAVGGESVRTIQPAGKIIRKTSDVDDSGTFATENLPALIVTLQGMESNPNEGSNDQTQNGYEILIQICDVDSGDKVRGLRTYCQWANRIARRLSDPHLVTIDLETPGVEWEYKHVSVIDAPDRKKWLIEKHFQRGVLCRVTTRESYLTSNEQ